MVDSANSYSDRVSRLVGWGHWFAFFNIIAAMLIGTRYITQSAWPETLLGQFYLASNWVVEIRISPHVGQVAADETQEEDGSNRTANVFMRQFTLFTPNPLRQT